jgi:hypothetical protein
LTGLAREVTVALEHGLETNFTFLQNFVDQCDRISVAAWFETSFTRASERIDAIWTAQDEDVQVNLCAFNQARDAELDRSIG